MKFIVAKAKLVIFLKDLYRIWFPWLDLAILAFIYSFIWGEYINPYRQYQLIVYGKTAVGKISGEDGLYAYSDYPRTRDFTYTFSLPNGKTIKSSAHAFSIDEVESMNKNFPVTATISYLPDQPTINWVKSNLPSDLNELFKRTLIGGTSFFLISYLFIMVIFRLSILEHREKKRMKKLEESGYTILELPKFLMN
ncbi:hypothetical protein [Pedobacter sp. BMA]|uniref:hypothetical protein n=1 Tax=Pedobacter sp. BMA TaxID=1663685 RepID=UPI00064A23E4|nr:hypothetical protein [Pedobacter sp. BMA]KLT63935.1 hypothetical protein AB669_19605 [Pedobacter sp. BMA]